MLPYRTEDEFRDRYLHTVIYFKGDPVYINDVYPGRSRDVDRNGEIKLIYNKLPLNYEGENKQYRELATHEGFTDSHNLGYANAFAMLDYDSNEVTLFGAYLSRMPIRRNKQGLFGENLYLPKGVNKGFTDLIYSSEFTDMLVNKYQTFNQIRELVTTNRRKFGVMGFDPLFALKMNKLEQLVLYYKEDQIGYSTDGGDRFNLIKGKRWLAEQVEEKGLKVA